MPIVLVDRRNINEYSTRVASRLIPTLSYQNLKLEYLRSAVVMPESSPHQILDPWFQGQFLICSLLVIHLLCLEWKLFFFFFFNEQQKARD